MFLKKLFFYRQHPETALRYLPIVDLIKRNRFYNCKILEVGSGSYGITPYLKKEIDGLDTSFDEPRYHLLRQFRGSADHVPFSENSYDLVILSDVLEHIPKNKRGICLQEAIRVSRKAVIISGPFGKEAFEQDRELAKLSMKKLGQMHTYFKEHLEYELPEISDLESYLHGNKKVVSFRIEGKFLNLNVRRWIMNFFITNQRLVYLFYLKGLMFLVPILRLMNQRPCYRTLILIQLR